jgi:hypothetical protein
VTYRQLAWVHVVVLIVGMSAAMVLHSLELATLTFAAFALLPSPLKARRWPR